MGLWNVFLVLSYSASLAIAMVSLYQQLNAIAAIEVTHIAFAIPLSLVASCTKYPYWTFFWIEVYFYFGYLALLIYSAFYYSINIFIGVIGFLRVFVLAHKAFPLEKTWKNKATAH